jgi:hypothetical protein
MANGKEMEDTANRRPKRRHPWRIAAAVLLLIGFLVALANYYARQHISAEAFLKANGYPVTLQELDAAYALPPDAYNAATEYLRAFKPYRETSEKTLAKEREIWDILDEAQITGRAFPPELYPLLDEFLTASAAVLDIIFAIPRGSACRYPNDFAQGIDIDLSHLAPARQMARWLRYAALHAAHEGDGERAVKAIQAGLDVAASLKQEPILISQLVRWALVAIMASALEESVEACVLNDAQLAALDAEFRDTLQGVDLGLLAAGEYLMLRDAREKERANIGLPTSREKVSRLVDFLRGTSLDYNYGDWNGRILAQARDDAALGPREFARRYRAELFKEFQARHNPQEHKPYTIYDHEYAAFPMLMAFNRTRTLLQFVHATIAIERYRRTTGALPASPEPLTPTWLESLPQDPYSDGPLRYRTTATGYVLYSVSEDFEDDGGQEVSLDYTSGEDWGLSIEYHCE